jgi:mono/diheme cytochrome c family protein
MLCRSSIAALVPAAALAALAACDVETADCETATQHVSACYGEDLASAFAETCTTEAAATALAEECGSVDGKQDALSTEILNPPLEHFKYGSIGSDKMGLPLVLMRALPLVCSDLLPAGADPRHEPLSAFGLIYEPGQPLPIGFSTRRLPLVGITLTGNNCSVCHTSTVRETPASPRQLYFGAPATRFDLQRYNDFLFDCVFDETRFNTANLQRAFDELGVTGIERLLATKASFIRAFTDDLRTKVGSVVTDGPWGPGRDDAIGLSGALILGEQFLPSIPGPVDFPAVWNQQARRGQALHWDGASGSALERNVLVAIGASTPRNGVPLASIAAVQSWLEALPAPAYPYAIDETLAAAGAPIFAARCASCHAPGGEQLWKVADLAEVGTDPSRVAMVTQAAIDAMNSLSGTGWAFDNFRKTNGYVNGLLDGIWLRAPYLHNGSVPTLRDLLAPPAERPAAFFRGNDTYDQANVGFVSDVASEGNTTYGRFDTARDGNSNAGHVYGTDLSEADKDALLEYMKTL